MPTTRSLTAPQSGPTHLRTSLPSTDLACVTENRSFGEVTISTVDDDGPSADAVNRATLEHTADGLLVKLSRTAGGTTIVQSGRGGSFQSVSFGGGGVFISGDNFSVIDGRVVSGSGTIAFGGSPITVQARLPHGSSVTAQSQSGDVRCKGSYADVDASTQSGDVDVAEVNSVVVSTMSGDIGVGMVRRSGRLKSMSGDVTVHGPASASCSVSTMSGDIRGSGGLDLNASSMSGRVRNR